MLAKDDSAREEALTLMKECARASSIEELAATINDIFQQVTNSAANAHEASTKANSVGEEMAVSNQKMQEMIWAMSEISGSSAEILKTLVRRFKLKADTTVAEPSSQTHIKPSEQPVLPRSSGKY